MRTVLVEKETTLLYLCISKYLLFCLILPLVFGVTVLWFGFVVQYRAIYPNFLQLCLVCITTIYFSFKTLTHIHTTQVLHTHSMFTWPMSSYWIIYIHFVMQLFQLYFSFLLSVCLKEKYSRQKSVSLCQSFSQTGTASWCIQLHLKLKKSILPWPPRLFNMRK